MTMLIIGRALSGVGAGGLMSMVFIILSDMLDMRERGKYLGFVGGIFSFSSVIGPLLGGTFTDHVTWRWLFWINLPIGAISILFIVINLNLPTPKGSLKEKIKRVDLLGSFLLLVAVTLILLPLSWGGSKYAWDSGIIIGLLCECCCGDYLCLDRVEDPERAHCPNLSVQDSQPLGDLWFIVLRRYVLLWHSLLSSRVLPSRQGESATVGGLETVPFVVGILITSVSSGFWVLKRGTFAFFPAMGNFLFITGSALCILFERDTKRVVTIFVLLVCGLGMGFTMQASTLAVQSAVKLKYMATVTASVQFVRSLGQVFGVAIVGTVFNNKLDDSLRRDFPGDESIMRVTQEYSYIYLYSPEQREMIYNSFVRGLHYAFYCCVAFCTMAIIMSCFIQHKELKTNTNQQKGSKPEMSEMSAEMV
ncbi:major facilitator superfamily domain-containing protein [Gamsiella multidivaricata]|uniref:major facilitator superfamily domain-containing protein n=1 Tax=Gamsiella multidivaricata TaxID=101098 RepID=UPI00221F05E6|nr:major facilitator superfamily domain-containing protein [Gamsiella multidivaricata]KAG0371309.1 hypothetical protein BGZ54_006597 [Gamsiella multidivaricata]KAI7816610.1 major facilitator superfamily domain-containing protein [Gamsiella multidivaricata]